MACRERLNSLACICLWVHSLRTGKEASKEASGQGEHVLWCPPQVWDLANDRRLGFLDRLAFHKAMDLISLAQTVRSTRTTSIPAAALNAGRGGGKGRRGPCGPLSTAPRAHVGLTRTRVGA